MKPTPKQKLRTLPILKTLPQIEAAEAYRIIDKGADLQLLYFWLNLKQDKYHEHFNIKSVIKQATYFTEKFPDLNDEIVKWVTRYTEHRKTTETNELIQKLDKTLSNETAAQQPDNGKLPPPTEDPSIQ
jgi:hypothetical protein